MAQKPKVSNLLQKVRNRIAGGRYRITRHADLRMKQRNVTLPAALRVLENGSQHRFA